MDKTNTTKHFTHNGLRCIVLGGVDGLYVRIRYLVSGGTGLVRFDTLTLAS